MSTPLPTTLSRSMSTTLAPPWVSQPSMNSWEHSIPVASQTEHIDNMLLSLIHDRRNLALSGPAGVRLIGPHHHSMRGLLYPEKTIALQSVYRAVSELLQTKTIPGLPQETASLFIAHHLMQLQVSPGHEPSDKTPGWYPPPASQPLPPYPVWINEILWGNLRERIVKNHSLYATDEFVQLYNINMTVNWPYSPLDAVNFHGGVIIFSPVFERHISQPENWSLKAPFAQRYPQLAEFCRSTTGLIPLQSRGSR